MNNSTSRPLAASPTPWPEDSFRPGPTLLVILGALVLGAAVGLAGVAWLNLAYGMQLRRGIVPVVPAVIVQVALEGAVVAALLIALPWLAKRSLRDLGFKPITPPQIGVALLGAVAMIVVVEGGAALLEAITHQKHEQGVVELFKQVLGQPTTTWLFVVFACVLAPFYGRNDLPRVLFQPGSTIWRVLDRLDYQWPALRLGAHRLVRTDPVDARGHGALRGLLPHR